MPLFVVTYEYIDAPEALGQNRPRHRAFLAALGDTLVASGPTDANGAVLVFEATSASQVEALLDADPFATEGLVGTRRVLGWTPVLGRLVEAGALG